MQLSKEIEEVGEYLLPLLGKDVFSELANSLYDTEGLHMIYLYITKQGWNSETEIIAKLYALIHKNVIQKHGISNIQIPKVRTKKHDPVEELRTQDVFAHYSSSFFDEEYVLTLVTFFNETFHLQCDDLNSIACEFEDATDANTKTSFRKIVIFYTIFTEKLRKKFEEIERIKQLVQNPTV